MDPWKEWLEARTERKVEQTLTDRGMRIEPRRPAIPGDVRAGLAVFLTLAPFAAAAGALLAHDPSADAYSATPSLPPSISDDLSTLPSASPSSVVDVSTTQRTTQPQPSRASEPAEPSVTRTPLPTATTTISPPSASHTPTPGSSSASISETVQSSISGSASATSTTPSPSP